MTSIMQRRYTLSPKGSPLRPPSSHGSTAQEEETDLEWMYQLDNLSKAYARTMVKKKRFATKRTNPNPRFPNAKSVLSYSSVSGTHLLNIIYMSMMCPNRPMSSEEIVTLGQKASRCNAQLGVTGFLLYTEPYFLQYLEGPPGQVKDLFTRIRCDPRHDNVVVISSRIIRDGTRNFGDWNMKTTDLDAETAQETAPLREILRLLSRQFDQLRTWLPRIQHDLLLSSVTLYPGCFVQCQLVAFAALPRNRGKAEKALGPMLNSLVSFLSRGGEIVGFLGDHLVGYAFVSNIEMLVDEAADLCADFKVHVGIAVGNMMLLAAGAKKDDCPMGFYGPLFDRARDLADKASRMNYGILADKICEVAVTAVVWEQIDGLVAGRVDV